MRIFRVVLIGLACLFLCHTFAQAKPKPVVRTYSVPCPDLWRVAKQTVKTYYQVLSLDNEEQLGSFTTGTTFSGVRTLTFSLSGTGDSCAVAVTGHFSGVTHHDKQDFFSRIEETLKGESTAHSQAPPEHK